MLYKHTVSTLTRQTVDQEKGAFRAESALHMALVGGGGGGGSGG